MQCGSLPLGSHGRDSMQVSVTVTVLARASSFPMYLCSFSFFSVELINITRHLGNLEYYLLVVYNPDQFS